jgi:hypothetical protein
VSLGTLDYHAVQTRFIRRVARGLSVSSAYTFGKAIDLDSNSDGVASFTNSYDTGYSRGLAAHDVRHVFTSAWIYALPLGGDGRLGGWQVSGILLARSGYPFTVLVSPTQSLLSTSTGGAPPLPRPDRLGSGTLADPKVDRWFDASAFTAPREPTGTYGSAGRNILRGPGQFTIDASVSKRTRLARTVTELRIEAFNLLNQPVFANPASVVGTASAGTITSLMPFTPMRQIQFALKVTF